LTIDFLIRRRKQTASENGKEDHPMKVQKLEPRDVELLEAMGFVIADDGESAEFNHSGDGGELALSIICPAAGTHSGKLRLDVRLPNGTMITGLVTRLHGHE
jgi:hypothetical protein